MSDANKKSRLFILGYRGYFWSAIVLGSIAAVVFYRQTFGRLFLDLFTTEGSYKLLIVFVSGWIIHHYRHRIRSSPVKPNIAGGVVLLAAGCFIYVSGEITSTLLVKDISLIFTALGYILLTFGGPRFKLLLLPILYLILLYPLIERLLGSFSYHFQIVAANIATLLLKMTGTPVFLDREFIHLPHISLQVARACNGIHHIISLLALAIPVAVFTQKTTARRLIVVVFAFFIGIFLNGFRVALIGVWSGFTDGRFSHGPFDLFYTSSIFVMGVFLIGITSVVGRKMNSRKKPPPDPHKESLPAAALSSQKYSAFPLILAAVVLGATIFYAAGFRPTPVMLPEGFDGFPRQIEGWSAETVHDENWPFEHLRADPSLRRIYIDREGTRVGLYIGYYATQTQEKEIVNDLHNWLFNPAKVVEIAGRAGPMRINHSEIQQEGARNVYYFWYQVGQRKVLHPFAVKFWSWVDALLYRKNSGAFVVISPQQRGTHADDSDMRFLKAAVPVIEGYLKKQ